MFTLKHKFLSLKNLGIAVEYFPGYTNRKVNLHSLDVVLLSFILRGTGRHLIENEEYVECGASLAITHYGQRHDILTDKDKSMDVINVYLDLQHHLLPVLPAVLQPVLPLLLPLHPRFAHRLNRIVRLQLNDPQPLAQELFAIQRELQTQAVGYDEAVRLHWKLFLMQCCRHVLQNGFVAPQSTPPRLEAVRQLLDETFAEPHTLDRLAKRASLSRTSLCRAFKVYTGKRLFDYLIERRIQAAMVSLRSTDEKVLTIALNCGFRDLAYFNRKFKTLVGTSPTIYRRALTQPPELPIVPRYA